MKKLFISMLLLLGVMAVGQTKANGYTYTSYKQERYKGAWKTYDLDKQETDSTAAKNVWRTSDVAIYHGDKYPVYLSKNGKLFIWVVSRETGNTYRKYIN
jgi:hypothetical protein